ncbi:MULTISPECIES: PEP-utilizing enzyme [unclassified Streptomyces]|uniref:PEP-utilizing enzyme n=1 Tax=unclassified Streptomyces TaxID=2593676 RepID=UPI0033177E73
MRAAAVVADHGDRTSRAVVVSRELGVPAVVRGTRPFTTRAHMAGGPARPERHSGDPAFTASPVGAGADSVPVTPEGSAAVEHRAVAAEAALDASIGEGRGMTMPRRTRRRPAHEPRPLRFERQDAAGEVPPVPYGFLPHGPETTGRPGRPVHTVRVSAAFL